MNRIIKFRVWDELEKEMVGWEDAEDTELLKHAFRGKDAVAMQFTGLKDKNGWEIYEGDICNVSWKNLNNVPATDHSEIRKVIFNKGKFDFEPISSFHHLYYCPLNCEVIGNIFQNPELLNAKTN